MELNVISRDNYIDELPFLQDFFVCLIQTASTTFTTCTLIKTHTEWTADSLFA